MTRRKRTTPTIGGFAVVRERPRPRTSYPFQDLEPGGDGILIPFPSGVAADAEERRRIRATVSACAIRYGKRYNMKFSTRTSEDKDGVVLWRLT